MDHTTVDAAQGPFLLNVRRLDGPEGPDLFDEENHRACEAADRVGVAILPPYILIPAAGSERNGGLHRATRGSEAIPSA